MRVELHPEARAELRSAAFWYDERRPGLGNQFVARVHAAFAHIAEYPGSHPTNIRQAIALHLEGPRDSGDDIPEPKTLVAVIDDA